MLNNLFSDPIKIFLSLLSSSSIVIGIHQGISSNRFQPNKEQKNLEEMKAHHELRKIEIQIANERFDAGCEGVFYLKPNKKEYQPLTEGEGVYSGGYWERWKISKGKLKPTKTDYLPAGTVVCDAYGNTAVLKNDGKQYAVVSDMANTPDSTRINKMISRYPNSIKPKVGI